MRDKDIAAFIAAREPEGMAACMRQYTRLLWTVASAVLKNTGCDQDVEECVADAFIYLWENPQRYVPERGKLKDFLCVIVRSRAIDRYRSLMRKQTVPLEEAILSDAAGVQEKLIQAELRKELLAAVQALGQPGREILVRRYYHNQKPREIALAMGMTVKQVDNALYRSKRQLRDVLTEKMGGRR